MGDLAAMQLLVVPDEFLVKHVPRVETHIYTVVGAPE